PWPSPTTSTFRTTIVNVDVDVNGDVNDSARPRRIAHVPRARAGSIAMSRGMSSAIAARCKRGAMVAGCALVVALAWLWLSTDIDRARFAPAPDVVTVLDRHGQPLRVMQPGGVDRRWVRLDHVSPAFLDAVVAVEDQRFWEHHGVDAQASLR